MATGSVATTPGSNAVFRYIARQPILDAHEIIYGYELLFRDGPAGFLSAVNSDRASMTTMDSSLLLGSTSLTGGKRAFINCTRELLVSGLVTLLPADLTVLEILEDVPPDHEVLAACRRLKLAGYTLAMDDFGLSQQDSPLLEFASIIKVDQRASSPEDMECIAHHFGRRGLILLSEKVETREEFEFAASLGYRYFQGYFFCRPVTLTTRDIPASEHNYLLLLQASQDPHLDLSSLERVIRPEVALCYRLLRYLNSAAFGLYPVRSIHHALTLLGEREVRKWIAMVTTAMMAQSKPPELIRMAMVRGRFCEYFAPPNQGEDYFLTGLFSLLDAMLDRPMERLVSDLPISERCRKALLGEESELTSLIAICLACEQGNFDRTDRDRSAVESAEIWKRFQAATDWASAIMDCTN